MVVIREREERQGRWLGQGKGKRGREGGCNKGKEERRGRCL